MSPRRERAGAPPIDTPTPSRPRRHDAAGRGAYRGGAATATATERADPLEQALTYAARGWHVFPVAPAAKRPHPRLAPQGLRDATTDANTIRRWWRCEPTANVGIACGPSGLVVLDVEHDGMESVADLYATAGYTPECPSVLTGGGGTHTYMAAPDDGEPVPSRTALLAGLDIKAAGGYVVAPPSVHPSGRRYEWSPVLPLDVPLAPVPDALAAWIREPDAPRAPIARRRRSTLCSDADVWTTVRRSPRVRARYERDTAGLSDTSPSGVDYALACALAWRGHGGDAIRAAIEGSRAAAGLPAKAASYWRATIGRAMRECAGGAG